MKQYSLSELCALIEDVVSTELSDTYWVRAEIASLSSKGGHGYFELVEKGSQGLLSAKIKATCWSHVFSMLRLYFRQETGADLQSGMQVLVEVEVTFHPVYGLSLNIINIDPSYTVGDIARQRQQTIARLQEEGICDMQRQLTLPTLPRRLAVISSDSAAGYEDFTHQLAASGYAVQTVLFPAVMQGERAEASMLEALDAVFAREEDFDAVVIIRGGGATTDLQCFDSYNLCAHCAQFPLPILSGIGHTRDVSVLDIVVHSALKTPTAVAAFIVDRFDGQRDWLNDRRQRLRQTADRQILIRRHALELLSKRLQMCSPEHIYRMGYSLLTVDGQAVRSVREVKAGQRLVTHLGDGQIESIAQ